MPSEQRDEHFLHLKRTITTRNLEMPKKKCIIYEDNKFGQWWQMYQTVMIIYVCIVIPYRMGTDAKDNKAWIIVNAIVDISFGIDMVLTFMTSYNNASTGKLVDDHKQIAKNYILSWFFIDLVSIFPIELIINAVRQSQTQKINSLARISRIGKLYKIARFFRLAKLAKLLKKKKRKSNDLNTELKLREGKERLMLTALVFLFFIHLSACFWLMTSQYKSEYNWLTLKKANLLVQGEELKRQFDTYLVSVYFVTQTVTTVGYGDYSPTNIVERIFVICLMLIGVIFFSFASASFASILQNYEQLNAELSQRLLSITFLKEKYNLSDTLFDEIKSSSVNEGDNNHDAFTDMFRTCDFKIQHKIIKEVHKNFENLHATFFKEDIERGAFCEINEDNRK